MRSSTILSALALASGLATPAAAQLVTSVDVGAASVTYDGGYRIGAMSVTPALGFEHARGSLMATGSLARFDVGGYSTSGSLGGSMLTGGSPRFRGELAGSVGGSVPEEGPRTAQYVGQARFHLVGDRGGAWFGGTAGQTWLDSVAWAVRGVEAGAWWRTGTLLLVGTLEPTRAGDSSYTDVQASARWLHRAFELEGAAGLRHGGSPGSSSWQALSGTVWFGRHVGLNAAVGSYLPDLTQATPGGRYVSIGLRLATRPLPVDASSLRRSARAPLLARPVADGIELRPAPNRQRTIRIVAPAARTVELMGDFTEWKIVPLRRARDGRWELTIPIAVGTHRFNIRVDGGPWSVPRGVTAITDDFEGVVGIVTVK